ncbi:MAG TPA: substrate-binding domain-containing protein [Acidimicrobiia bacterium]
MAVVPRVALVIVVVFVALTVGSPAGVAAPARINGSGSNYVALAMQQWVADAQTSGLAVNYLPTSSPEGLTTFANGLTDFAGTEAEFSALGSGGAGDGRGYQYVPDVAGAVAVMYNVTDVAGTKVDYLHLSPRTIARIFTGEISSWSDPAISADNTGLKFPDQPITVVYRGGQSGTTALFYDFISHVAPDVFNPWAARNQFPTQVRIIQLDSSPSFVPKPYALGSSDQIAQFVASDAGRWSISYDEFGYAKVYGAPAAWVQNASGQWVLPYATNISAALESATLRPDLSQDLAGVYTSGNPLAYPLSAYSYMVSQCAGADRPTCKGPYANAGIAETLSKWWRYIACEGQVNMARIGYSPLPPNLSQEMANSIARLTGGSPETLNVGNCANPRFAGNLGEDSTSPPDKLADRIEAQAASDGGGAATSDPTATTVPGASSTGAGAKSSADESAGGGSGVFREAAPVAYTRPGLPPTSSLLVVALVLVVALPPIAVGVHRRRKKAFPGESP